MDQAAISRRGNQSNIARPVSRLPLARAPSATAAIHQDESSKKPQLPRVSNSSTRTPNIRPLGESNNAAVRPSFGWAARQNAIIPPTRTLPPVNNEPSLDTTPPRDRQYSAITEDGDENATGVDRGRKDGFAQPEKRRPRPSLSERTIETLSQISPGPSPSRRRSSTLRSSGSMGPPARPASAMRNPRPETPSTPSTARAPSPVKRPFKPPGRSGSPAKDQQIETSLDTIYTPPRAFVRDHSSRIGRPRDDRRSSSTTITAATVTRPSLRPAGPAVKVKSMYDIRAAASRTLQSMPSLPALAKEQVTPAKGKPAHRDGSPHASLMKTRHPSESVLASTAKVAKPASKMQPPVKRTIKRTSTPDQSRHRETSTSTSYSATAKSSSALRDTIAKAKAARREGLRKSGVQAGSADQLWTENDASSPGPTVAIGGQSLKRKILGAVTTGVLNLSAMSLHQIPQEMLTMYDFKELQDNGITWSEAVDLQKLILADNEIEVLPDVVFPDWSEEEMLADTEKSNEFAGLSLLDMHGNNLTSVPVGFRRLQQLKVLNLSNNSLDVSLFNTICDLTSLQELRLAKNGLSGTLPPEVGSMTALQILDLSDNQLDKLPAIMANMRHLQKLLLSGNKFSSLSLHLLPAESLLELDVSKNMLDGTFDAENDLSAFQKLKSLNISFNNVKGLCTDAFDLLSLQTLAIHNNRITALPQRLSCPQLTTLTASENALASMPSSFYTLRSLRNADLSGNSIKTIESDIANMENLSAFNLAGNPLREKKYLTMDVGAIKTDFARKTAPIQGAKVRSMDSASAIDLSTSLENGNDPAEHQLHQPKGGILDLSSRSLPGLDPSSVDLTAPIHTIRLANNDFTALPIELLMHPSIRGSLKSLDMSHNPSLHPTDYLTSEIDLPLLQSLYIVSTGLTTLDTLTTHLKAPNLRELNISCHRMTGHLPCVRTYYPLLTTLLASDNWFESIDVEAVRGLEVLDIRNNEVELLPPGIGLLGNHAGKTEAGRLRSLESSGNKFRVPRLMVLEKGTEATLRDLRRMIPAEEVPEEWRAEV